MKTSIAFPEIRISGVDLIVCLVIGILNCVLVSHIPLTLTPGEQVLISLCVTGIVVVANLRSWNNQSRLIWIANIVGAEMFCVLLFGLFTAMR